MQLILDIGNSYTKTAVFDDNKLCELFVEETFIERKLIAILEKYTNVSKAIVSSVLEINYKELLSKHIKSVHVFNNLNELPITNLYKTPETLGNDRLAGIIGAINVFPSSDVLVIDAGTAITYDLVTKDKNYHGGSISPGINMRYKALHTFTGKLPLVSQKDKMNFIGDSTENAIASGVQNGIIYEIETYINNIKNKYPEIKIILTGGDADFIRKNLKKNTIFVEQNLILKGLNSILTNNA